MLQYSDRSLIDLGVAQFDNWPDFFDPIEQNNWCYYFELAELELQRGNYAAVAQIADQAFDSGETPKRSWERAPFIEGYGFMERWQDAVDLTAEAMSYSFTADQLICSVWSRIEAGTPDTEAKQAALDQVSELVECGND
jgi:hypothetical protein